MNYRHIYHAGNFADVVKHTVLLLMLEKMRQKDRGITVLDAFAGIGVYSLSSDESFKTCEARNGVIKLFRKLANCNSDNSVLKGYQQVVMKYNRSENICKYPGSPAIIANCMRDQDRLICVEKHEEDFKMLKRNLKNLGIKSAIHCMDGYDAIKGISLQTGRGLIVVDPSFEVKNEFEIIIEALSMVRSRYISTPIFIWYPIKDEKSVQRFYKNYNSVGYKESIILEFGYNNKEASGLTKCGIIIANPPHVMTELKTLLRDLSKFLYDVDNSSAGKFYNISIK